MENVYHIPAMLKETIEGLAIKPNGVYVDVTFGGGGHSRAVLEALENSQITINNLQRACKSSVQNKGHLFSFDQDIEAYENAIREKPHPNPPLKGEGSRMTPAQWTMRDLSMIRNGRLCIVIFGTCGTGWITTG